MMMLGLSSRSAPDAPLEELLTICARRGFVALEVEEGHAHGLDSRRNPLDPVAAARRAEEAGIRITGYRTSVGVDSEHEHPDMHAHAEIGDSRLGRLGKALGATIVLDGPARIGPRLDLASALQRAGVRAAVVVEGEGCLDEAAEATARGLDIVWDADPGHGGLGPLGALLLERHADRLHSIRLLGGGPETATHEGGGLGELMGHLALARYAGSVIVSPSSTLYRVAWRTWLGRRGGSGCAGTQPGDPLVDLPGPAAQAGSG
jgi:hypothetical protein